MRLTFEDDKTSEIKCSLVVVVGFRNEVKMSLPRAFYIIITPTWTFISTTAITLYGRDTSK